MLFTSSSYNENKRAKKRKRSLKKWKEGAVMSIAQFDEIYDICCEEEDEVTLLVKVKIPIEHSKLMKDCIPDSNLWWEGVVKEVQRLKESELSYV
jgi:hypothetical protein